MKIAEEEPTLAEAFYDALAEMRAAKAKHDALTAAARNVSGEVEAASKALAKALSEMTGVPFKSDSFGSRISFELS